MAEWVLNWQVTEPGIYDICDDGPCYPPESWFTGVNVFIHKYKHGECLSMEWKNKISPVQYFHGYLFRKK
jgi:hypothetical protein